MCDLSKIINTKIKKIINNSMIKDSSKFHNHTDKINGKKVKGILK